MFTRPIRMPAMQKKVITFTGGINESKSNLELKPGECFDLLNYEEISGEFHGYRSTMGYERIDGTVQNIEDPNSPGTFIDVSRPSDVPLVFTDPDDFSQIDDTAREARRTAIVPPNSNSGSYSKGAFDFDGSYFTIVYDPIDDRHRLWRLIEGTGWSEITSFPVITDAGDAELTYHFEIGRFQTYPTAPTSTPNTDIVIMCNGISPAVVMYKTNAGVYTCISLVESNGPDYQGTPFLPSDPTILESFPKISKIYNQRLHIGFDFGTLFVSHVGDPFQYDAALRTAGLWWLGNEITDMIVAPSSLVVFMESGIDVIRPGDPDLITGFDEVKETFSPTSGAFAKTAQRILGRTLFCDDRGITSLESADTWGDFNVTNLSLRVQKTYQDNKNNIAGTAVDREKNQYIVYFTNGEGIVLTVAPDFRGNFSVRGTSIFNLGESINTVWGVRKESRRLLTSNTDSFLKEQWKDAQSFDGAEITSRFTTAFHPYGSPVNFKTFTRLLFELTATKGQVFSMRPIFDYRGSDIPRSVVYSSDPQPDDGIWGTGVWGTFTWGGTGAVNQEYSYINGIGVNMSIQFSSTSKYHSPHVVHNAITLYSAGSTKF